MKHEIPIQIHTYLHVMYLPTYIAPILIIILFIFPPSKSIPFSGFVEVY